MPLPARGAASANPARATPGAPGDGRSCSSSCLGPRSPTAHQHFLPPVSAHPAYQPVRRVAFGTSDLGCGDQELEVERLAQVEEHAEVVVREPVGLVEKE